MKADRKGLRRVVIVALLLVGAFATIGEGSTDEKGKQAPNAGATSGEAGEDTVGTDEGSDKATAIAVGTQIKVSSGWEFRVNSAEINANETVAKANQFNTPDEGMQYLTVNVTMINKSGKADSPLTNLQMSLLPPSGVGIDSEIMIDLPESCDSTAKMQPDAEYTCNEAFQVKIDEAENSLLIVEPVFTLDDNAQRFFALK